MLKQRSTAELKYEQHQLEQKKHTNVMCSSVSVVGACIVVSIASAPATVGTSTNSAAVLAVGSALQIMGLTCLEREQLRGVTREIQKRNVKEKC